LNPRRFSITFLGTAAASLSPQSSTSAYLVEINRSYILIDAGIGALRQIKKVGVSPKDINIILITHWHIDHFAGLPAVLRAKRKSKLPSIFGPSIPLSARIFLNLSFYPLGRVFESVTEDFCYDYEGFSIEAIPNCHGKESYGWGISEQLQHSPRGPRKIVISGDTRPAETILKAAQEVDLLVHEATYLNKDINAALLHRHSTAKEAAELARKARVGALALTHIPSRCARLDIQEEAQKFFPQVLVPSSLDKIHLDPLPEGEHKSNSGWAKVALESGYVSTS
jgi:ribonuclease Z